MRGYLIVFLTGLILCVVIFGAISCATKSTFVFKGNNHQNLPPVITGNTFTASDTAPDPGQVVTLTASASDPEGKALTYLWSDNNAGGVFVGTGSTVTWSHDTAGTYIIKLTVTDADGQATSVTINLTVAEGISPFPVIDRPAVPSGYVGRSTCLTCHSGFVDINEFTMHRHNHKLNPPTSEFIGNWWNGTETFTSGDLSLDLTMQITGETFEVVLADTVFPLFRAMGWGVEKWKQRYIVEIGNSVYILPNQWNVVTEAWVPFSLTDWADATGALHNGPLGSVGPSFSASFDRRCVGCHTTGATVSFAEETGEWISNWTEDNVQCEACHGPGQNHASSPSASNIVNPANLTDKDRKLEVCGRCHSRGSSTTKLGDKSMGYPWRDNRIFNPGDILADYYTQTTDKKEFWNEGADTTSSHALGHHEQYNDFLQSKHYVAGIQCWNCHNPHAPDVDFDNSKCTPCHATVASDYATHTNHADANMKCIDCHMPYTVKSAIKYDVRSHVFDIISPETSLTMLKGGATDVIPNSCMNGSCHPERSLTVEADI